MNNYEKRTLKKKNAIISSAMALFTKNGFTNVSIKDIATSAEVSQVSIYNYFGNKESLVLECAKLIMNNTINLAEEILISDETFISKIEKALLLCNNQINLSLSTFLSKKAIEDIHFVNIMTKNINSLKRTIFIKYVEYGKKENAIDNSISNETICLFIDAINNLGMSILEEEIKTRQNEIIQLFLYGLIGNPNK